MTGDDLPRPRIAVTLHRRMEDPFGLVVELCNDYAEAIWTAGGVPWPVPFTTRHSQLDTILRQVDGLILSGGSDIDPSLYNEEIAGSEDVDPERDTQEVALLKMAMRRKIPVFGICRGFQMINVFFGGALHQHVEGHRGADASPDLQHPMHKVKLGGYLAQMYNRSMLDVNSYHHQSVKTLGKKLVPLAWNDEGHVEGMVSEDHMILAVQWHPEIMVDAHQEELAPFRWIVKKARKHREIRKAEKAAQQGKAGTVQLPPAASVAPAVPSPPEKPAKA